MVTFVVFHLNQGGGVERNPVSCGQLAVYEAQLHGRLRMVAEFLPEKKNEFFKEAITRQFDYFSQLQLWNKPVRWSSLSYKKLEIKFLKINNVSYGVDLKVDPSEVDKDSLWARESYYFRKAVRRGTINASDQAIQVEYIAKVDIAVCHTMKSEFSELLLRVPVDPYLAYWSVGSAKHVVKAWERYKIQKKVNPCSDDEVVDLSLPDGYWYAWNPLARGRGVNGKKFDCRYDLPKASFVDLEIDLKKVNKVATKVSFVANKKRKVKISFFLGFEKYLEPRDHAVEDVRQLVTYFLEGNSFEAAKKKLPYQHNPERYDLKFNSLLTLLWRLRETMTLSSKKIKLVGKGLKISLLGTFKKSKQEFEMDILFTPNANKKFETPVFIDEFSRAFAGSDLVIYHGHSGLGDTFSPKYFGSKLKKRRAHIKNQLFAILGCYSYHYFPPENFPNDGVDRKFIYNASALRDVAADVTAGLIELLDQALEQKTDLDLSEIVEVSGVESFLIPLSF